MIPRYIVMTRRSPPYHDAGNWTEHYDLDDALACAASVAPAQVWQQAGDAMRRIETTKPEEK